MRRLSGVRVLVTRPAGQGSKLAGLLEAEGAEAILIPTIELAPPYSWCALDAALVTLRSFDWVVFTSANAVRAFAGRARRLRLGPEARRVAVIGPATGRAVEEELGRAADLMPGTYVAEALAEILRPSVSKASVLLVRATIARDILREALNAAGATVTIAEAYRNVVPESSVEELRRLFAQAAPDAITFTSASTAVNLRGLLEVAGLDLPRATVLASIGPITSQAMREAGLEPSVEAAAATISSLVEALCVVFRSK